MAVGDTYKGYQEGTESGHKEASGTEALQNYQSSIPTSDADLRTQAEEQYKPTYETLNRSYADQLSRLIQVQSSDDALLNEQYNNSIASMTAQLKKRGLLPTTQLEAAQTAALNKHKNEAKDVRASIYNVQKALPEQQQALLQSGYEDAIAQRVSTNRASNIPLVSDLLGKLAELQQSSFEDYLNFLLAKKSSSGGGGGGYSRSYGRSSTQSALDTSSPTGNANGGDFSGGSTYEVVTDLGSFTDQIARDTISAAYSKSSKLGKSVQKAISSHATDIKALSYLYNLSTGKLKK